MTTAEQMRALADRLDQEAEESREKGKRGDGAELSYRNGAADALRNVAGRIRTLAVIALSRSDDEPAECPTCAEVGR